MGGPDRSRTKTPEAVPPSDGFAPIPRWKRRTKRILTLGSGPHRTDADMEPSHGIGVDAASEDLLLCRRCGNPVRGARRNGFCSDACRMAVRREEQARRLAALLDTVENGLVALRRELLRTESGN